MDQYVFTNTDPREEGYKGDVVADVKLTYDMNDISSWPEGTRRPMPQLGHAPEDAKEYKVFKYPEQLNDAGYKLVHFNAPVVAYSWTDYRKRYYPVPEEYAATMTEDEWFDFLEQADAAAKVRQKQAKPETSKPSGNTAQIAEWVAKRHMGADGGISQVWYLPAGSRADQIRLLEVSDRFVGDHGKVEPFDFGLEIDGTKYQLWVADISSDHLARIKADPTHELPKEWDIDGAICWGRRA